jgi:hypothetical protein
MPVVDCAMRMSAATFVIPRPELQPKATRRASIQQPRNNSQRRTRGGLRS